jgi:hypothetical protein
MYEEKILKNYICWHGLCKYYFVSFIWGGFLKEESENIPKALDLGNTSGGKRRDGGACVNESLFFKNQEVCTNPIDFILNNF